MSDVLLTARMLAGLTRPELAAIAGVAPSTILRIESGEMVPTTLMLDRLVRAAGYRLESKLVAVSDIAAVAAARGVLDPGSGLIAYPGASAWVDRWTRAGFISDDGAVPRPARLAEAAGLSACLAARPGLVAVAQTASWRDVADKLRRSALPWAATGGVAANRLVRSADAPWFVFYVDDPRSASQELGLVPTNEPGPKLALIPFAGIADVGVETDANGYRWAEPLQVLIDCYGGTDRMPQQAEALAAAFDAATFEDDLANA